VNITVFDEDGYEVIDIHHFRTRYVEDTRNVEDDMYNIVWVPHSFIENPLKQVGSQIVSGDAKNEESVKNAVSSLESLQVSALQKSTNSSILLITGDPSNIHIERVNQLLEALRKISQRVIQVSFGDKFSFNNVDNTAVVRTTEKEDYKQLLQSVVVVDKPVVAIIHATLMVGSLFASNSGVLPSTLSAVENDGCLSTLAIVQTTLSSPSPPRLYLLTAGFNTLKARTSCMFLISLCEFCVLIFF
jgi:hypothetical protein